MADTTIVIDADAAKYLASLVKADQANKKVQKSAAEIGVGLARSTEKAEDLVGQVVALGTKTALVAAAGKVVTATWDNWINRLEKAQKLMEATTKGLQKAAAPSGANVARLRTDLLSQGGTLNLEQKTKVASIYAGTAPGANDAEILKATREADLASQAGLDAEQFAQNRAKIRGLGNQAGDIAAQVMSQGGDQAGQMIEILQTIATRLSPEQAKNAIGMVTGSGQIAGGTALLQSMLTNFLSQGRTSDFTSTVQGQGAFSLAPGLENRKTIQSLKNSGNNFRNESLLSLSDKANQDQITLTQNILKQMEASKEAINLKENAAKSIRMEAAKSVGDVQLRSLPEFMRYPLNIMDYANLEEGNVPGLPFADSQSKTVIDRATRLGKLANNLEGKGTYTGFDRRGFTLHEPVQENNDKNQALKVLYDISENTRTNKRLSSSNGEPR